MTDRVSAGVDAWLRWLPKWTPGTHRGKSRLCRRCTGSPVLAAAGITGDTPHQVTHALVSRMHRIIDKRVDEYTADELPTLHAELTGAEIWRAGGFDPSAGLDPEFEGIDPDPEFESGEQPVLFTMAGLAEEVKPDPPLPQPPLSPEEKRRLRAEIDLADRCAAEAGREVCFALVEHKGEIGAALQRFVEPQVQAMLEDLSKYLEPPQ
ncbi:MAG: spermidine/putrescine ABC transporter substrate-binding protein [Leucobacter sp.]